MYPYLDPRSWIHRSGNFCDTDTRSADGGFLPWLPRLPSETPVGCSRTRRGCGRPGVGQEAQTGGAARLELGCGLGAWLPVASWELGGAWFDSTAGGRTVGAAGACTPKAKRNARPRQVRWVRYRAQRAPNRTHISLAFRGRQSKTRVTSWLPPTGILRGQTHQT